MSDYSQRLYQVSTVLSFIRAPFSFLALLFIVKHLSRIIRT